MNFLIIKKKLLLHEHLIKVNADVYDGALTQRHCELATAASRLFIPL